MAPKMRHQAGLARPFGKDSPGFWRQKVSRKDLLIALFVGSENGKSGYPEPNEFFGKALEQKDLRWAHKTTNRTEFPIPMVR
jgi:hypothetical protein